jgi:hypothetical protein
MSKHAGSNIESMYGNLSFGYEALSSEGSIEQIEENRLYRRNTKTNRH